MPVGIVEKRLGFQQSQNRGPTREFRIDLERVECGSNLLGPGDADGEDRLLGKEGQAQHQITAREQIQPAPRSGRGPLAETEQHNGWIEDQNAGRFQPRFPGRGEGAAGTETPQRTSTSEYSGTIQGAHNCQRRRPQRARKQYDYRGQPYA